jgi:sugar transferase (PEP-CTERM/EpsH1 system associated)
MKILFLTPQLPYPPQKGTSLRSWGLMSNLAARHEMAVLSFLGPDQEESVPSALAQLGRVEVVRAPERTMGERLRGLLASRRPDMALRLASEAYSQLLGRWLAEEAFDVAQIAGIEMAPYLSVLEEAEPRPLIVFDDLNCEHLLQRRVFLADLRTPARWTGAIYSLVQWLRLRKYESEVCRRSDRVLAVSDADARALRCLVGDLRVAVVPNGVDTQYYRPVPDAQAGPGGADLVFTGTMDFRPNVDAVLWFAREILPLVRAEAPRAHFLAVGQRPHRRLHALAGREGVTLTGHVDDVRPYIARAAVYVAPLRSGGGTRLKLLEAMAMGKAIVSTTLGAEGFPVADGRQLLLADTSEAFSAAILKLLSDPQRRKALGRAGRLFAERGYDWSSIVPLVEAAYEG